MDITDLTAIIDYKVVRQKELPPHSSSMYEYLFAANGVFIRGIRPGLEVLMPVEYYCQNLQALPTVQPYIQIYPTRIPKSILLSIWQLSCKACNDRGAVETVFHIHHEQDRWRLEVPEQEQHTTSCKPLCSDSTSSFFRATIDLHSHHTMPAFFSSTDDADEGGFRIYAVLGRVNTKPEIRTRIGLFRHYWEIPASLIFELPVFVSDLSSEPQFTYQFYRNIYLQDDAKNYGIQL